MPRSRLFRLGLPLFLLLAGALFFTTHVLPRWFPQVYASAWGAIGQPDPRGLPQGLQDLPLVMVDGHDPKGPLVIMISGNGGWWGLDDQIAAHLADAGVTTVGLNSVAWFIERRTPEETAAIIDRIAAAFDPNRELALVGYSFGADIAATVYAHLSPGLRGRIKLVSLLGLSRQADYAIGFWKVADHREATLAAVSAISGPRIQCFRGLDEGERSACNLVDPGKVEVVTMPGGHHFGGDYETMAKRIVHGLSGHVNRG
jgi:type IV secretory pathway VirJ component